MEIARLEDDSAESDPFLCQLLLEDSSDQKANGGCEEFKALLRYVDREVHVGDVIEAVGYPEKTIKGRVSLHVTSVTIKSKCTTD
jgi:lysyl-tRNA synthetase class II